MMLLDNKSVRKQSEEAKKVEMEKMSQFKPFDGSYTSAFGPLFG